jgi:hypothetical protein
MLWATRVRSLSAAVALLSTVAFAQQQVKRSTFLDRCYGRVESQPAYVMLGGDFRPPSPPPLGYSMPQVATPSFSVPSGSGGSEALMAMAVVAVVAAAALPVIVYVADNDPPPRVLRDFFCPRFGFDGWGGVESAPGNGLAVGIATARVRMAWSYFGTDVSFQTSPGGIGAFSAHGIVRPTPKEHIQVGVAIGYQRALLGVRMREGFEVGIPQLYTVWRNAGRELQIELRPGVFITTQRTVDVSLDSAVHLPLLEFLSVRLGSRLFSYDGQVLVGVNAGLSLHL